MPEDFLRFFVISNYETPLLTSLAYVLKGEIDVTMGYNNFNSNTGTERTATSGKISEVMFHELTHAAHYNKVGNAWWNDFVDAQVNNIIWRGSESQNPPYGLGDQGADSDIIAVGESWAYHMGHFLADRKYGLSSSDAVAQNIRYTNNVIIPGSSHINLLEDFSRDRSNDPDNWIPIGLYYDLMDNRNDQGGGRVNLDDTVLGYSNQQFFNALDSDIRSTRTFQSRLLAENGNNQAAGVNIIFNFYVR